MSVQRTLKTSQLHKMSNHTTSHRLLSLSAEFPLHGLESFSQKVSDPYSDPFDSFTVRKCALSISFYVDLHQQTTCDTNLV